MSFGPWRTAYGSAAGTSHLRVDSPCQDAGRCAVVTAVDGTEILVASVADGAGSASQAEHGARLAVESFITTAGNAALRDPELGFLDALYARSWLAGLQREIASLAAFTGNQPKDYACTFLGAVVSGACAAFVQIGDGAIVIGTAEGQSWVFWPQHGEFANSTFFVTMEEAAGLLMFDKRPADGVSELAMFSDGLERLILDMTGRTVHAPSLRPVLGWLGGTEPCRTGQPSDVLLAYLNSANVNRRTDDDKTLVLATRAPPPETGG